MARQSNSGRRGNLTRPGLPEDLSRAFPAYRNLDLTEVEINALSQPERLVLLRKLDYRRKYQLLTLSDDMEELVRAMPAEDLYFTIEAAGRTDAMELFASASPRQVTRILDITCWDHDRFNADDMLDWFGYLVMLDPEMAIRKFCELDPELIMRMLASYLRVRRFDWHEKSECADEDNLFSLDDTYAFEMLDPETDRGERLTVLLQMLYRFDYKHYKYIMEALLWESAMQLEELSFKAHENRLSDIGYPTYLEALQLFSPIDPERVRDKARSEKPETSSAPLTSNQELPSFYGPLFEEDNFLMAALRRLDESRRQAVAEAMMGLGNRILVARKALRDLDLVIRSLKEVRSILSIGLEYVSDGETDRATEILSNLSLSDLFRTGHSLTQRLHKSAKLIQETHIKPNGRKALDLIGSPDRDVFLALLRQPAAYFEGAEPGGGMEIRPFERLSELQQSSLRLQRIRFLFDLHFAVLALDLGEISERSVPLYMEPAGENLRFIKLFLTVYARMRTVGQADYRPLSPEEFEAFLTENLEKSGESGFSVRDGLSGEIANWLAGYVENRDETFRRMAREWVVRCVDVFGELAGELTGKSRREAIGLSRIFLLA